ncbi:unnamed protein product [Adineta ricciae]|uniref:SAM domain-containing protein n=1 Tax=Adineta ricciae TaxID=249248 RepID=A0A814KUN6_ADIRI|nr:unnamed protein product [Adineta ricciae]
MATGTRPTKPTVFDPQKLKEKGNRRPEGSSNSTSSGSLPKRYQSVFIEGTPLTSFGVRNDDNQLRTHSPSNHIQTQSHQRPLKPVKEFLTTNAPTDQRFDHRWPSNSQTNNHARSQTETTVQNVNIAVSKSLKKLRQDSPVPISTTNGRSSSLDHVPYFSRPSTSQTTSHSHHDVGPTSNFYYQTPGGIRGPLPAQLITKRPSTSRLSNNQLSSDSSPTNGHQPIIIAPAQNTIKSIETGHTRALTAIRVPAQSLDVNLQPVDGFNFDNVNVDEHPDKSKKSKAGSDSSTVTRSVSRKQSITSRIPTVESQHRSLPEVSINPHIQSAVPTNDESLTNGLPNEQTRPEIHESYAISNTNLGEKYTNHHHIQVEPIGTFKRPSSPVKSQQVIDIRPNVVVQHQRSTSKSDFDANNRYSSAKHPLSNGHVERNHINGEYQSQENTPTNNETESTSTLKRYIEQEREGRTSLVSPPSPVTQELNRIWKKQRNRFVIRSPAGSLSHRKSSKTHRPSGRLKNYDDESDSETTATETQSREEELVRRHGAPPSDLGSDFWSDLTSEFSDTKLRKHPNIRTSTPNITARSSSMSSKEIGQIRRQLTDLQAMYNDLLKLLDVDVESVRGSLKSNISSQIDHNNRRHRFRKIMPTPSLRQSNIDMGEVNQRFTRLESSVVTLAESIAKLSAQIQNQRTVKDDVFRLRQEVSDLRQQLYHHYSRQPSAMQSDPTSTTPQQPSRLLTANVQRLATINSSNHLNYSSSYMPSTSTIQRSNSVIDPRQARKIEQFFGPEAMLRYFLSLLNYEEYASLLEREKIGFYELPYISEKKLQSLGIPYGPCARIVYEAQQYFISLLTLKSSGIDV